MATKKITELTELSVQPASNDVVAIVDIDADVTKKITISNLQKASFPFTGDAQITGSLNISGSTTAVTASLQRIELPDNSFIMSTGGHNISFGESAFKLISGDDVFLQLDDVITFSNAPVTIPGTIGSGLASTPVSISNILTGNITASGNISSSATSTSSFGTYLGDGSQLTGLSTGTPTFIGSGSTSASADPNNGVVVNASGSTLFDVRGSLGSLFSVTDSFDGNLFEVNNISGISLLSVSSSGDVDIPKGKLTVSSSVSASQFLGDGSQLTGVSAFPFTGDAQITGSLIVSSSNSTASLSLQGSGSTVFEVIGSEGTIFKLEDDLDGVIFTANDRTGLPVLQAEADGEVYLGKTPQSLYTTAVVSATSASSTASLVALSTSSYDSAYFDFTCTSASNSTVGSIMSTWNGATIAFNEHATSSIGTTYRTAGLDLQVIISASQAQLVAITDSTSPNTWKVKTTVRAI